MIALDDEVRWILGRPNFACHGIAESLRRNGHMIERKAEAEQAAVLHFMLSAYEEYGKDWRDCAENILMGLPARSPDCATSTQEKL